MYICIWYIHIYIYIYMYILYICKNYLYDVCVSTCVYSCMCVSIYACIAYTQKNMLECWPKFLEGTQKPQWAQISSVTVRCVFPSRCLCHVPGINMPRWWPLDRSTKPSEHTHKWMPWFLSKHHLLNPHDAVAGAHSQKTIKIESNYVRPCLTSLKVVTPKPQDIIPTQAVHTAKGAGTVWHACTTPYGKNQTTEPITVEWTWKQTPKFQTLPTKV